MGPEPSPPTGPWPVLSPDRCPMPATGATLVPPGCPAPGQGGEMSWAPPWGPSLSWALSAPGPMEPPTLLHPSSIGTPHGAGNHIDKAKTCSAQGYCMFSEGRDFRKHLPISKYLLQFHVQIVPSEMFVFWTRLWWSLHRVRNKKSCTKAREPFIIWKTKGIYHSGHKRLFLFFPLICPQKLLSCFDWKFPE